MKDSQQGAPDAAGHDPLPLGDTAGPEAHHDNDAADDPLHKDSSVTDDIAALIDSGRTYAEAEFAFQKTRLGLVAGSAAKAVVALVLALVMLHIALVALAVGAVIALAPLITIWGAIGVVVGAMLLGVGLLVRSARSRAKLLSVLFASPGERA